MRKVKSLVTLLLLVVGNSYAAQDCANFAMLVGEFVDVKNSGITYTVAKQKLAENKRNVSGTEFKQMFKETLNKSHPL